MGSAPPTRPRFSTSNPSALDLARKGGPGHGQADAVAAHARDPVAAHVAVGVGQARTVDLEEAVLAEAGPHRLGGPRAARPALHAGPAGGGHAQDGDVRATA